MREENAIHATPFIFLELLGRISYSTPQLCLLLISDPVERYAILRFASDCCAYMAMQLFIALEGLMTPVAMDPLGMSSVYVLSKFFSYSTFN